MTTLIPCLPKLDPVTEQKVEGLAAAAIVAAVDAALQEVLGAPGAIDGRQVALMAILAAWLVVRRGLLSLFQPPPPDPPGALDHLLTGGALPAPTPPPHG